MRVIVGGVYRTGTASMRAALWQLGFHDCYHMHAVLHNLESHPQLWVRALAAKRAGRAQPLPRAEWDALLGHCQACCDVPAALFGPELARLYPDAKVVVLHRSPEAWLASARRTIDTVLGPAPSPAAALVGAYCRLFDGRSRNWARLVRVLFSGPMDFDHGRRKDRALAWFEAQYREFRDRIPAERRIDYRILDGWAPLCAHLGVPVPMVRDAEGRLVEAPFPRLNGRDDFAADVREMNRRSLRRAATNMFTAIGVLAVVVYLLTLARWLARWLARLW
ncbi:hypothetical protein CDD83_779 [Cordyceps sp. RAO-2017]|nr:hypothetical protein CDD83_779 [Cordyceps sp. RAO-2017]